MRRVTVRYTPEYTVRFYFTKMSHNKQPRWTLMDKHRMLHVFKTFLPEIVDVELHQRVSETIKEIHDSIHN